MAPTDDHASRRHFALGALGTVGASVLACNAEQPAPSKGPVSMSNPARMPVVYLPHGGGPWPFVDLDMGDKAELDGLAAYLRGVAGVPKQKPRAILAVSAHWEESKPTVMTGAKPPLFFDYYGFPPESYKLTWPAPGDPVLAARVRELLGAAGFESGEDAARGFDHGTFVPLKLTYPEAEIPTVQLSLKKGLSPAEHLAIGRAIAPLRDEGVFIVASGMSFHNMRSLMRGGGQAEAAVFDDWLAETMTKPEAERDARLGAWASAPAARDAHPREEHLLPLMVAAGAAGGDAAERAYAGTLMGFRLSAFHFG